MSFMNWMFNNLASEDIVDLYFVLSDLVDIELTEAEIVETACLDSQCSATVNEWNGDTGGAPIGKLVL